MRGFQPSQHCMQKNISISIDIVRGRLGVLSGGDSGENQTQGSWRGREKFCRKKGD